MKNVISGPELLDFIHKNNVDKNGMQKKIKNCGIR